MTVGILEDVQNCDDLGSTEESNAIQRDHGSIYHFSIQLGGLGCGSLGCGGLGSVVFISVLRIVEMLRRLLLNGLARPARPLDTNMD